MTIQAQKNEKLKLKIEKFMLMQDKAIEIIEFIGKNNGKYFATELAKLFDMNTIDFEILLLTKVYEILYDSDLMLNTNRKGYLELIQKNE